jgi:hypothetical protein
LRDDEGLITISWEDVSSISAIPDITPFSAKVRIERDSVSSTALSSLSLSTDSLRDEWTPLSSPALSAYAECISQEHFDSLKQGVWKNDAEDMIEETLKWIFEYV